MSEGNEVPRNLPTVPDAAPVSAARRLWNQILELCWEPKPLESSDYEDAAKWGKEFRSNYLNGNDKLDKEKCKFLFERGLADLEHAETSGESLQKKCSELLKLNAGMIIGLFALVRFFKDKDHPLQIVMWSNVALLIAIIVVWRGLAGVPKIASTNVFHLANWERSKETLEGIQYNAVTFLHRQAVANEYVNDWMSKHLTTAWMITIAALAGVALELLITVR